MALWNHRIYVKNYHLNLPSMFSHHNGSASFKALPLNFIVPNCLRFVLLFALPPLCWLLLLLSRTFMDGVSFDFLREQICRVTFAAVRHSRILLLAAGGFHTSGGGAFFFLMDSKSCVHELGDIQTDCLLFRFDIPLHGFIKLVRICCLLLWLLLQRPFRCDKFFFTWIVGTVQIAKQHFFFGFLFLQFFGSLGHAIGEVMQFGYVEKKAFFPTQADFSILCSCPWAAVPILHSVQAQVRLHWHVCACVCLPTPKGCS